MRPRLLTLACALGALLLFGTLFLRSDPLAARRASSPTTVEHGSDGMLGAASWLRAEGVRTVSWRERFGSLSRHHELAQTGNLLIISLPAVINFRTGELVSLDTWIRNGNTLLVLAALRDRPAWAQFPFVMSHDLEQLTGLSMVPEEERASRQTAGQPARARQPMPSARVTRELTRPQRSSLIPNRPHPYFTGVGQAVALSDYVPFGNTVTTPSDGFALSLAHEDGSGRDAFWVRADGDGAIIVSAFGSLFSNRALGLADNARLLANLVAASVSVEGAVVLDDEHQGLTAAYDPASFYRDGRLYGTLAIIAAVWLIWVLGGTQLQAPAMQASAPREAELVRTAGLFLARVLTPAAAARRMLEGFLQRLGGTLSRSPAPGEQRSPEQLWEWLENNPRLARTDVQQLREWHAAAHRDRRVPLTRLHNLILRTERQLAQ
ncbi:MAG: DUF4350 domain-containing protein [Gammaproteobacteria bacterium]|nr:DUF4350 domain-containing protein [Gammaproteobacteria bacterium]